MHSPERLRQAFLDMINKGRIKPELCKALWNSTDTMPRADFDEVGSWSGFAENHEVKQTYGAVAQELLAIWKEEVAAREEAGLKVKRRTTKRRMSFSHQGAEG